MQESKKLICVFCADSVVPVREQSTETATDVVKRKPYSPFQAPNNKAEYALARVDDLLNWARKVGK